MLSLITLGALLAASPATIERAFAYATAAEKQSAGHMLYLRSTLEDASGGDDPVESIASLRLGATSAKVTVLSMTKGGRVLSRDEREQYAARDPLAGVRFVSPFLPSERKNHSFEVVPATKGAAASTEVTIRFVPVGDAALHKNEGTAIIDGDTGAPLRIELSPSRRPMFVSSIKSVLVFGRSAEPWPAPASLTTKVEGGFLFIKKQVLSKTTFSRTPLPMLSGAGQP